MLKSKSKAECLRGLLLQVAGALCVLRAGVAFAVPTDAFEVPGSPVGEGSRLIMFDLQPSERCNFGDLDGILNDLRYGGNRLRLQLSVEALGVNSSAVQFGAPVEKKLSQSNLGTYEVTIPSAKVPTLFGVFLCTVPAEELGKTPCSHQKVFPFEQIAKPYNVDTTGLKDGKGHPYTSPQIVEPKVYFAQFVTGGLTAFSPLSVEGAKAGSGSLEKIGIPKADVDNALPQVEKLSATLGSLPLQVAEGRFQIVLPFYSDKKCNLQPQTH